MAISSLFLKCRMPLHFHCIGLAFTGWHCFAIVLDDRCFRLAVVSGWRLLYHVLLNGDIDSTSLCWTIYIWGCLFCAMCFQWPDFRQVFIIARDSPHRSVNTIPTLLRVSFDLRQLLYCSIMHPTSIYQFMSYISHTLKKTFVETPTKLQRSPREHVSFASLLIPKGTGVPRASLLLLLPFFLLTRVVTQYHQGQFVTPV